MGRNFLDIPVCNKYHNTNFCAIYDVVECVNFMLDILYFGPHDTSDTDTESNPPSQFCVIYCSTTEYPKLTSMTY